MGQGPGRMMIDDSGTVLESSSNRVIVLPLKSFAICQQAGSWLLLLAGRYERSSAKKKRTAWMEIEAIRFRFSSTKTKKKIIVDSSI